MGFVFGYGWVGHPDPGGSALTKVDPASGRAVASIDLPGEMAWVGDGPSSLWYLSSRGDLLEIDPVSATVGRRFTVPGVDGGRVVIIDRTVWICDCGHRRLLRFDPETGSVAATIELQQEAFLLGVDAVGGRTLWLLDPDAATLAPLDAASGRPGRPLGIGGGRVYDASIAFGSIWVAAGPSLYRFDLPGGEGRRLIEMPDDASAGGLAMNETDGIVWVENCGCPG